jgi:hypothetical protein
MPRSLRSGLTVFVVVLFGASAIGAADAAANRNPTTKAPASASRPATKGGSSARGPLPDPTLFDGSAHPVENRPEHGMIGDFELPGNENAPRDGRVGGQQPQMGGGGGQSSNMPQGMPQGAAGAQGAQGQAGGPQGPQGPQGAQTAGGADAGGAPPPGGAQGTQGGPGGGPSDPNAKAEGVQVAGLTGEASSENAGVRGKPPQVAIGDTAARIEGAPQSPDVVGSQTPAGPTQQHAPGTGSGGKGPAGPGGNKGVEKGRTMPSGL